MLCYAVPPRFVRRILHLFEDYGNGLTAQGGDIDQAVFRTGVLQPIDGIHHKGAARGRTGMAESDGSAVHVDPSGAILAQLIAHGETKGGRLRSWMSI